MKIFVTGLTGSGKTTAARRLGGNFINYDNQYGYTGVCPAKCRAFLDSLPADCVVDAVPLNCPPADIYYWPMWETFNEWAAGRQDYKVFCTVLPYEQWLQRDRPYPSRELWDSFWVGLFPSATFPMTYIDSTDGAEGQELRHARAMDIINMKGMIRDRINWARPPYDARYQDIDEIGLEGYSGSWDTWTHIRHLANWQGSVVDCGAFHGFMLFRIRDAGGSGRLLGLDFMEAPLVTARAINALRNDSVSFRQWNAGEPVPEADVTLCLNALHHFEKSEHGSIPCTLHNFFRTIQSPVTIFEVGTEFYEPINEHWPHVDAFPSARPGRVIYRCQQ